MRENSSRNQDGLKYQKLYNWGRTLIMSGVLRNMDKFPSEHMLQNKFGYSRQTVRNALDRLEQDGLIARVKGSGTYVSYAPEKNKEERPRIGLILSYFSDYLFPQVYEGIESVLREEGYEISVSVTRNRLNDEALYLKGMLGRNVSGLIIEGTRSSFPNPNLRLYKEIRRRNIPTLFFQSFPLNFLPARRISHRQDASCAPSSGGTGNRLNPPVSRFAAQKALPRMVSSCSSRSAQMPASMKLTAGPTAASQKSRPGERPRAGASIRIQKPVMVTSMTGKRRRNTQYTRMCPHSCRNAASRPSRRKPLASK